LWIGRGGVGEESEEGARDSRMGRDPDQLAFWMEVLEAGMGDFLGLAELIIFGMAVLLCG